MSSNLLLTRASRLLLTMGLPAFFIACAGSNGRIPYHPQVRDLTVTTVPLLTKELSTTYPFLVADFARGGVLASKEVYAFVPGNLTVMEGDTVHFTLINPEDDVHSFILPPLSLALPPQSTVRATYIARVAGIFTFSCNVPTHVPMMYGQLVVLAAR